MESNIEVANKNEIIKSGDTLTFHITYNENLTMKEMSELLDLLNKAINDCNREYGVQSQQKIGKEFAPIVTGVSAGSIVLYVVSTFIIPLSISVLANFISARVMSWGKNKKDKPVDKSDKYRCEIEIDGETKIVDIHVIK